MKKSKPSSKVLYEYVLNMGEKWVEEEYGLSGDEIDEILYGGKIPTEERNRKKVEVAFKKDNDKNMYRVLRAYYDDKFIWDEPTKNLIRCQNAEERPMPMWTESFLEDLISMYLKLMEWDMKLNNNGDRQHGWSLGNRTINKTSSMTTDDDIHERILRYLEEGKVYKRESVEFQIKEKTEKLRDGHGKENENFLENIETTDLDHIKRVLDDKTDDFGNTDMY